MQNANIFTFKSPGAECNLSTLVNRAKQALVRAPPPTAPLPVCVNAVCLERQEPKILRTLFPAGDVEVWVHSGDFEISVGFQSVWVMEKQIHWPILPPSTRYGKVGLGPTTLCPLQRPAHPRCPVVKQGFC